MIVEKYVILVRTKMKEERESLAILVCTETLCFLYAPGAPSEL